MSRVKRMPLSGKHIEKGAQVEVMATECLTLYVDRLPPQEEQQDVSALLSLG